MAVRVLDVSLLHEAVVFHLAGFSAAMVGGLALSGMQAGLAWPFWLSTGLAGSHLAWQVATADLDNSANLAKRFDSNKWVGALIFAGVLGGRLLQ